MPPPDFTLEKAEYFERRALMARSQHDHERWQAAARNYRALLKGAAALLAGNGVGERLAVRPKPAPNAALPSRNMRGGT
jgi:hypothetical protein